MGGAAQELFHMAATAKLRVYRRASRRAIRAPPFPEFQPNLTLSEFPGRRFHGKLVRTADAMDSGHPNAAHRSGCRQSHRASFARAPTPKCT